MCFCLFILSFCFRMQLTYTLTIHLWNSILSMLPYFHEYARCFAKRAPCVPARMWTNQIAYNYHVTSCVCRLALSYYVVKFYEWSTWYFGGNQIGRHTTRHRWLVNGSLGFPKSSTSLPQHLEKPQLAQDDVDHLGFVTAIENQDFSRTSIENIRK